MSCAKCGDHAKPCQRSRLRKWALPALLALFVGGVYFADRRGDSRAVPSGPLRVEVGVDGFSPGSVSLPSVGSARVLFRRISEQACAHALVYPKLNLETELPLGEDVALDLPASAPRRLAFQCGAGPYRGKVVIN